VSLRISVGDKMLEDDDMEVLEEINKIKSKKSFKDLVNGKRFNPNDLDEVMTD
jgi:hypothetical protein